MVALTTQMSPGTRGVAAALIKKAAKPTLINAARCRACASRKPQTGAKRERDSAKHKIVVRPAKSSGLYMFAELTTPSARTRVASRCLLTAQPPLLFQEGSFA